MRSALTALSDLPEVMLSFWQSSSVRIYHSVLIAQINDQRFLVHLIEWMTLSSCNEVGLGEKALSLAKLSCVTC